MPPAECSQPKNQKWILVFKIKEVKEQMLARLEVLLFDHAGDSKAALVLKNPHKETSIAPLLICYF